MDTFVSAPEAEEPSELDERVDVSPLPLVETDTALMFKEL